MDLVYAVSADHTETTNIGGIVVALADEDSEEKEISEVTDESTPVNPLGGSGAVTIYSIFQIVTFLALSLLML